MKVCKFCRADGALNSRVVRRLIPGPNADVEAFVCERCLEQGRVTKATCRTFVSADPADLETVSSR